jgi:hypothetical protein
VRDDAQYNNVISLANPSCAMHKARHAHSAGIQSRHKMKETLQANAMLYDTGRSFARNAIVRMLPRMGMT